MPYLKFATEEEKLKAYNIIDDLAKENNYQIQGLVSILTDLKHGLVLFCSEEPYMTRINQKNLNYQIIPKEQISSPYVEKLRELHPDFLDEL